VEAAEVADHLRKPSSLHDMDVEADFVGIYSMFIEIDH